MVILALSAVRLQPLHCQQQKALNIRPKAKVACLPAEHMLDLHTHFERTTTYLFPPQAHREEVGPRLSFGWLMRLHQSKSERTRKRNAPQRHNVLPGIKRLFNWLMSIAGGVGADRSLWRSLAEKFEEKTRKVRSLRGCLCVELVQQRLGRLQIRRIKTFGKPAIDGGEQGVGFGRFSLALP